MNNAQLINLSGAPRAEGSRAWSRSLENLVNP